MTLATRFTVKYVCLHGYVMGEKFDNHRITPLYKKTVNG